MKKIYCLIIMALGLLAFSACEEDRSSNPILNEPDTFVLNVPPYAQNNTYDLAKAATIEFTCSQPDYGFPAATTYSVQLAFEETFIDADEANGTVANYVKLNSSFNTTKLAVDAGEFALAMVDLWAATSEEPFPTQAVPVYVRLIAAVTQSEMSPSYSNIIELPKVLGYTIDSSITIPTRVYIISNAEGTAGVPMLQVTDMPGKFWRIHYFAKDAAFKLNSTATLDGGEVSYSDNLISDESKALADIKSGADGNIVVGNEGWYTVVVTVSLEDKALTYLMEFLEPKVYLTGDAVGTWGAVDEANRFTVPETGDGEFVSPAAPTTAAAVRMFALVEDPASAWWKSEFTIVDKKVIYRENNGDLAPTYVTPIAASQKVYINFITGVGSVK